MRMNSVQELAMKVPSFDGTLLACRVWEDPATDRGTQVVLLLHGLAHHGNAYGHVGGHLAAAGIPVCAWDARGPRLFGRRAGHPARPRHRPARHRRGGGDAARPLPRTAASI